MGRKFLWAALVRSLTNCHIGMHLMLIRQILRGMAICTTFNECLIFFFCNAFIFFVGNSKILFIFAFQN